MNNKTKIGIVALVIIVLVAFFSNKSEMLGTQVTTQYFNVASSTGAMTVGPEANTLVLAQRGSRRYASVCNNSISRMYIYLYSTTTLATTSATFPLETRTCAEFNSFNMYTGIVKVVAEATTTSLYATEFINNL